MATRIRRIVLSTIALFGFSISNASAEPESWYAYWGIGSASHTYEEPLNTFVELLDAVPGVERSGVAIDMLGFYFPLLGDKLAAGVIVSGSADRLEDASGNYIQLNQYLYAGSMMFFPFGDEIGDGLFLRLDVGSSKLILDSSSAAPVGSDSGTGSLFGIGWGFPLSPETRLLISLTASHNEIEGLQYNTTALRIGGMW